MNESLDVEKWLALGLKWGVEFCGTLGWEMISFLIFAVKRLKSKVVQNRHGSHPCCTSYKQGYLRRTAVASLTLFTIQQNGENDHRHVGSSCRRNKSVLVMDPKRSARAGDAYKGNSFFIRLSFQSGHQAVKRPSLGSQILELNYGTNTCAISPFWAVTSLPANGRCEDHLTYLTHSASTGWALDQCLFFSPLSSYPGCGMHLYVTLGELFNLFGYEFSYS